MRKPRKPSDGKNKRRLDKKQLIMLPAAASIGFIVILIMNQATPKILEECFTSDQQAYSIHVNLEVFLDGQPMDLPDNLGYEENCIKPLHLHGEHDIHVIYDREIRLTLFEFIKLWGIDLNNYETSISVKMPDSNEYLPFRGGQRALPFEDDMSIRIELKSKS
ncbi:MAG: hypothetical protein KatS3mg003_0209 [Candidatus Nitrosocaldaceae archaeon]|nr:MAG: hypothetical protein KatS3mg003_0209 [Candidatus Nitrosocaldaceae archaeon]